MRAFSLLILLALFGHIVFSATTPKSTTKTTRKPATTTKKPVTTTKKPVTTTKKSTNLITTRPTTYPPYTTGKIF